MSSTVRGQCVPEPVGGIPGIYQCSLCGWKNKTPRDRPPRRNCGSAPAKSVYPQGQRTEEELDRLIAKHCAGCPKFRIAVCSLDTCKASRDPVAWRRKVLDRRYTCALGKWETNGKPPDGRASLANVTACITAFKRPESLQRLLASLKRHYPELAVDVEDTGGNLSAGRNRLVSRCKTPFVLILEDDFEVTPSTKIATLCDVLNSNNEVGIVAGAVVEMGRLRCHAGDMRLIRGTLERVSPPADTWRTGENGSLYRYCDSAANFFLARRDVLIKQPWDEELPLLEHTAWFWMLKKGGHWRVAQTDDVSLLHHRDRPTDEYTLSRKRATSYWPIVRKKYGFGSVVTDDVATRAWQQPQLTPTGVARQNLIVFGAGHQGTRLVTQLLALLGWNAGIVKKPVWENVKLQRINQIILRERGICNCGALIEGAEPLHCLRCKRTFSRSEGAGELRMNEFLAALEQPWVLKDPRLVTTIMDPRWRQELEPYAPTLIHLERDYARTVAAYRRSGWKGATIYGYRVDELLALARDVYRQWPYGKATVTFEQIIRAAGLVDLDRALR